MFLRIAILARPYWKALAVIAVLILVMSGLKQIEPIVAQQITDLLIGGESHASNFSLVQLLGILLVARLGITFLNRASWYLASIYTQKLSAYLREVGFEHLTSLSLNFFNKSISGKMMSQLDRGVNRITSVINNSGMHFIPAMVTAIISVVLVMRYSVVLGIAAILSFVPFSIINWLRFKKNEKLEKREHKLYDNQYAHFWETISSIELIKSFMAEGFELRRLKSFHKRLISIRKKMERNNNVGCLEIFYWIRGCGGLYAYIVYLAYLGNITVGTMVLLVSYIQMIRQPLWELNWIYWEVRRAQLGAKEFFEILDAVPDIADPKTPAELDWAKGRITFEKVSFMYPEGKDVFKNLSFTIKPGEMVALVGPSGSGKTTIASFANAVF